VGGGHQHAAGQPQEALVDFAQPAQPVTHCVLVDVAGQSSSG
jgi:hypothetical protein